MVLATSPTSIRLLGPLEVRRPDGGVVDARGWRTGKTSDLLRLLALQSGDRVSVSFLVDALWPDVEERRALASLRTAASWIRHAVGTDCVRREPGQLVLVGCEVDVAELRRLDEQVVLARARGDHPAVLARVDRAELLYADDFHAHDDLSDWALSARADLLAVRVRLLSAAAESALELGRHDRVVALAGTVVGIDRYAESAHRMLMVAYAELGEVAQALRVFESYRRHLADELGADPSRQTRDLHRRLLQDEVG